MHRFERNGFPFSVFMNLFFFFPSPLMSSWTNREKGQREVREYLVRISNFLKAGTTVGALGVVLLL